MKKMLSLVLALLMLFSCVGVSFAGAADEEDVAVTDELIGQLGVIGQVLQIFGLPENEVFYGDIDEIKESTYWDTINFLGMDLDFMYTNTNPLMWSTLDVYLVDENGKRVLDEDGNPIMLITRGTVGAVFSGINSYLKEAFYNSYGGLVIYNVETAISLANVIGGIFYRDFVALNPDNFTNLFGNKTPSAQDFFETVAEISGLGTLIQENWVPRGKAFCEPVVNALGGSYTTIYSDNYKNGKVLGARILEGMFAKMCAVGPAKTIVDALKTITRYYEISYREPLMALFTHKMQKIAAFEDIEKYETFSGLLELIFCDCDPVKAEGCFAKRDNYADEKDYYAELCSVDHFCPLDFPTARIANAEQDDEIFIYLYYYFNLCGAHRNNAGYIEDVVKAKIDASKYLADEDKDRFKAIVDGYCLNNIAETTEEVVIPHLSESLSLSSDGLIQRLKNGIAVLLKKIADYFDYIRKLITGELNYGQGGSPFI